MWQIRVETLKIEGEKSRKQEERLGIESSFELHLKNPEDTVSFNTSHTETQELIKGYCLVTHKVLLEKEALVADEDGHYSLDLCGKKKIVPQKFEQVKFNRHDLFKLMVQFQENAILYKDIAITSSAAFAVPSEVLYFSEDLDQENAIYKTFGKWEGHSPAPIWLISGKIGKSIATLAKEWGVQCLISRLGVTDQAHRIAQAENMMLIGFARGTRMTVYNGRLQ